MRFEPRPLGVLLTLLLLAATAARAKAQEGDSRFEVPTAPPPATLHVDQARDPIYRELSLRKRLDAVTQEEARLLQRDRELQPLTWPKVAMIAGFSVTGALVLANMSMSSQRTGEQSDASEHAPSETTLRLMGTTMVAGMATGFTGLGILLYRVRHRPHRAQALELQQEHRKLQREIDELVRRQRQGWSLAPSFFHADARVGLQLRRGF